MIDIFLLLFDFYKLIKMMILLKTNQKLLLQYFYDYFIGKN